MKKKILLVARDAAPSGAFKQLAPVLTERKHEVKLIVGDGKPIRHVRSEIMSSVQAADIVLIGMSSSRELAEPEIFAASVAKEYRVPYGFYGDVPRCWGRARKGEGWFAEVAQDAVLYLTLNDEDAAAAREAGVFPKATCIATGNPLREEMAFPRYTRAHVRGELGVRADQKVVLAAGGKTAAINMLHWGMVMEALKLYQFESVSRDHFYLVLAPHPGDRTPFAIDPDAEEGKRELKLYDPLVALSPFPAEIVPKARFTTSELVPAADIIIEFGSSIGIEGAYQGVPVITFASEIAWANLQKVSGTRSLEAVEQGISRQVRPDAAELAGVINELVTPSLFEPMRARQLACYPKPTDRGAALRKMAEALDQVLASKK